MCAHQSPDIDPRCRGCKKHTRNHLTRGNGVHNTANSQRHKTRLSGRGRYRFYKQNTACGIVQSVVQTSLLRISQRLAQSILYNCLLRALGYSAAVELPVVVVSMGSVQALRADLIEELMASVVGRMLCLAELRDPWAIPVHKRKLATMAEELLLDYSFLIVFVSLETGFVAYESLVNPSRNRGWQFSLVSLQDTRIGITSMPRGNGQRPSLED